MSIVGLYSKIQYLEAVINDVKKTQSAAPFAPAAPEYGLGDMTSVPEEKAIDLTQLNEFNELTDKVKALEVVDGELSTKIAEVPALLSAYVPLADFAALTAKVEKIEKLNSQMDKLNSKMDSLISKVAALESQTPPQ